MAAKKLINRTGAVLNVTLIVRKGDLPTETAGTVEVVLAPFSEDESDGHVQIVEYGNETDIYLNGIDATLEINGLRAANRSAVLERGTPLDDELNTKNTIEFLYDGNTVLFSASETDLDLRSHLISEHWAFSQVDSEPGQ